MTDTSDTDIEYCDMDYNNCIITNRYDSDTISDSFSSLMYGSPVPGHSQQTESDDSDTSENASVHLDPERLADATLNFQELYQFILGMLIKVEKYLDTLAEDVHTSRLKTHILLIKIALIKHYKLYGIDKVKEVDGVFYTSTSNAKDVRSKNNLHKMQSKSNTTPESRGHDMPSTSKSPSASPKTKTKDDRNINSTVGSKALEKMNKQKLLSWKIDKCLGSPSTREQSNQINEANTGSMDVGVALSDQSVILENSKKRKSIPLKITQSPRSTARKRILEFQIYKSKSPKKKSADPARTSGMKHPQEVRLNKSTPNLNNTRRSLRLQEFKRDREVVYCDRLTATALKLGSSCMPNTTIIGTAAPAKPVANKAKTGKKSPAIKVKQRKTANKSSSTQVVKLEQNTGPKVSKSTIKNLSEARGKLPVYKTRTALPRKEIKISKVRTKNVPKIKSKLPSYKIKAGLSKKEEKTTKSPAGNKTIVALSKKDIKRCKSLSRSASESKSKLLTKATIAKNESKWGRPLTSKSVDINPTEKAVSTSKKRPSLVKKDTKRSRSSLKTKSNVQSDENSPNKRFKSLETTNAVLAKRRTTTVAGVKSSTRRRSLLGLDSTNIVSTKRRLSLDEGPQKEVKRTPLKRKIKSPVNKQSPKSAARQIRNEKPSTSACVSPKVINQSPNQRRKTVGEKASTFNTNIKKRKTTSLDGGLQKKAKFNKVSSSGSEQTFSGNTSESSGPKRKLYSVSDWLTTFNMGI